jgi:hypothetical protein
MTENKLWQDVFAAQATFAETFRLASIEGPEDWYMSLAWQLTNIGDRALRGAWFGDVVSDVRSGLVTHIATAAEWVAAIDREVEEESASDDVSAVDHLIGQLTEIATKPKLDLDSDTPHLVLSMGSGAGKSEPETGEPDAAVYIFVFTSGASHMRGHADDQDAVRWAEQAGDVRAIWPTNGRDCIYRDGFTGRPSLLG